VLERHPARQYCWWWKDTLHVRNAVGGDWRDTLYSKLLALHVHIRLVVVLNLRCDVEK
jgi:hypothetical protein